VTGAKEIPSTTLTTFNSMQIFGTRTRTFLEASSYFNGLERDTR